jgi:hypothetical protein
MKNHHVQTECTPRERFSPLPACCLMKSAYAGGNQLDDDRQRVDPVATFMLPGSGHSNRPATAPLDSTAGILIFISHAMHSNVLSRR